MKAVMIIYNQAHTEKVDYMLTSLGIRGFSMVENVQGRGSNKGAPHLGTHTWPEINSAMYVMVDDEMVDPLLEKVRKIDSINEEVGIRAFVWNVEQTV
ncbi:MAG: P-II family nitrogen regulator [Bacteroidales bacterium]